MKLVTLLLVVLLATLVAAQRWPRKNDCPPSIATAVCNSECLADEDCVMSEKCCRTTCGGSICVSPIAARSDREKSGNCPATPTGGWVCSSTCTYDSHCRGSLKCCRGRCPGSRICQKPAPT